MTGNRSATDLRALDDRDLLALSVARVDGAFARLLDRHSVALYRYAFHLTQSMETANEVVRATWLGAWRGLADIRLAGDSLLPWLLARARHECARRDPALDTLEREPIDWATAELADPGDDPAFVHASETDWAFAAAARLGDIDKHVVEICLYEGRSYITAVRMLGLVPQGMGTRLERARYRWRAFRTRYGESEAML